MLLLTDDKKYLYVFYSQYIEPKKVKIAEKATGIKLKDFKIDMQKSKILREVIKSNRLVYIKLSRLVHELLPKPLAVLISKLFEFDKHLGIFTPLKKQGETIGIFFIAAVRHSDKIFDLFVRIDRFTAGIYR